MGQFKELAIRLEELKQEKDYLQQQLNDDELSAWLAYSRDSWDSSASDETNLSYQVQELRSFILDKSTRK